MRFCFKCHSTECKHIEADSQDPALLETYKKIAEWLKTKHKKRLKK